MQEKKQRYFHIPMLLLLLPADLRNLVYKLPLQIRNGKSLCAFKKGNSIAIVFHLITCIAFSFSLSLVKQRQQHRSKTTTTLKSSFRDKKLSIEAIACSA